jgi:SAM-dependent methyltransferase
MDDRTQVTRASYDTLAAAYVEHIAGELAGKPLDRHLLNRFVEEVGARGRILDLGCGPGHVARYLRERSADVFGIDLSPGMIRHARQLNPGIEFSVGDMRALDLEDGSVAGILAFYCLIHLEDREIAETLRELRRVLMPDGVVLAAFHIGEETLHRDELWGHPISLDFRFLMPSRVKAQFETAGLAVTESVEREPYPDVEHPSRRCYLFARSSSTSR